MNACSQAKTSRIASQTTVNKEGCIDRRGEDGTTRVLVLDHHVVDHRSRYNLKSAASTVRMSFQLMLPRFSHLPPEEASVYEKMYIQPPPPYSPLDDVVTPPLLSHPPRKPLRRSGEVDHLWKEGDRISGASGICSSDERKKRAESAQQSVDRYPIPPVLHVILQSANTHMRIDLSRPSTNIRWTSASEEAWMKDAATCPPLTSMRITCPSLPWTVDVARPDGGDITCADVIETIIAELEKEVTDREWMAIPQRSRGRAIRSLKRNCQSDVKRGESRTGVTRRDFLMGRTWLGGLAPSRHGFGIFQLYTSFA